MEGSKLRQMVQGDALTNRRFLNVFAANELPYWMPSQSMAIVNCCDRRYPGEHWIALYKEGDRLEVFDSYGLHPNAYSLMDKLPDFSVMTHNARQLQSLHSNVCGQYCLYYCYFKARGFAMDDIIARFSRDHFFNDEYVYGTVLNLYHL